MSLFQKKRAPVLFKPPKSVATITAGLSDTLAELEDHAKEQAGQVAFQKELAERALLAADEHKAESDKAYKVAGNIRTLLSA